VAILQGHTGTVWGVALSTDGWLLASGGTDGTVRLWEVSTGIWLRTLRPERRYERLAITGLNGITPAQRTALLALGAVEHHRPASEPTATLPLESVR
jgi:WD40 repeat protein